MIVKNFEFKRLKKETFSFFLFYGDNQAFKDELINLLTKERNISKTIYYEHEILKNTSPNKFEITFLCRRIDIITQH